MAKRGGSLLEEKLARILTNIGLRPEISKIFFSGSRKYEVDVYVDYKGRQIGFECKERSTGNMNVRNLIFQWESKVRNELNFLDNFVLVIWGPNISDADKELAQSYNITIIDNEEIHEISDRAAREGKNFLFEFFKKHLNIKLYTDKEESERKRLINSYKLDRNSSLTDARNERERATLIKKLGLSSEITLTAARKVKQNIDSQEKERLVYVEKYDLRRIISYSKALAHHHKFVKKVTKARKQEELRKNIISRFGLSSDIKYSDAIAHLEQYEDHQKQRLAEEERQKAEDDKKRQNLISKYSLSPSTSYNSAILHEKELIRKKLISKYNLSESTTYEKSKKYELEFKEKERVEELKWKKSIFYDKHNDIGNTNKFVKVLAYLWGIGFFYGLIYAYNGLFELISQVIFEEIVPISSLFVPSLVTFTFTILFLLIFPQTNIAINNIISRRFPKYKKSEFKIRYKYFVYLFLLLGFIIFLIPEDEIINTTQTGNIAAPLEPESEPSSEEIIEDTTDLVEEEIIIPPVEEIIPPTEPLMIPLYSNLLEDVLTSSLTKDWLVIAERDNYASSPNYRHSQAYFDDYINNKLYFVDLNLVRQEKQTNFEKILFTNYNWSTINITHVVPDQNPYDFKNSIYTPFVNGNEVVYLEGYFSKLQGNLQERGHYISTINIFNLETKQKKTVYCDDHYLNRIIYFDGTNILIDRNHLYEFDISNIPDDFSCIYEINGSKYFDIGTRSASGNDQTVSYQNGATLLLEKNGPLIQQATDSRTGNIDVELLVNAHRNEFYDYMLEINHSIEYNSNDDYVYYVMPDE